MRQEISLSENDYLQQLLFSASKSKIVKRRLYGSWIITVCILVGGSILLYRQNKAAAYYCLAIAVACALFHPMYSRWRYKKYYQDYVRKNYKNNVEVIFNVEFQDGHFLMQDATGESKVKMSEIENIDETRDHFFLTIKGGQAIIIPKGQIQDRQFVDELQYNANWVSIEINKQLDWKWE